MIIVVANQKGGVGKTTTTLTLAHLLSLEGEDVAVVDLDAPGPNRAAGASAAERRAKAIGIPAYTIDTLPDELPRYVLIDCPPDAANEDLQAALGLADFVVVPTSPSIDELEVAMAFASRLLADRPYRLLLTRVYHSGSEAATTRKWLRDQGFGVMDAEVTDYRAYKDAALRDTTVAGLETYAARRARRDYLDALHEIRRTQRGSK